MWGSLGEISSNDARRKFIEKLEQTVPVFAPFMIAHQKEKEEMEKKRLVRLQFVTFINTPNCRFYF